MVSIALILLEMRHVNFGKDEDQTIVVIGYMDRIWDNICWKKDLRQLFL